MTNNNKWLEQFNENYYGRSKEAQELEKYLKSTFKGNAYIPWAVMERMTYQQDPDAVFEKQMSEHGNMVQTSSIGIEADVKGEHSMIMSTSHFVRVTLTFLGKTFEELYPIQDTSYGAPKVYDQNMVNKAFQRAIAKVASRATGLGLSLYENGELQFETETTDTPKKKSTVEKTASAIETLNEQPKVVEESNNEGAENMPDIDKIIEIILSQDNEDKVNNALRSFNPSFIKQFGFSISRSETADDLRVKLSKLSDPSKFLASLRKMVG